MNSKPMAVLGGGHGGHMMAVDLTDRGHRVHLYEHPRFEESFQPSLTKKAIEAIRPGIRSKQIDDVARNYIVEKGYGDFFGHGLGHGLGMAVHEAPSISPLVERDVELAENMVFTIEPGIDLPDWGGIRLESMVRVTSDGAEVLNRLPIAIDFFG